MQLGNTLSFIPLGGVGDVTRNMYVYEYKDEILIVDCGLGFANETMIGVDLLLPDISYLLQTKKRIAGMVFTHGHEDHVGALPFILPQLQNRKGVLEEFPLFATPLTAALANEKLKEFQIKTRIQAVPFETPEVRMGSFGATFIRVTHSVPDSSHIFIETPAGNMYHGSDFKFDLTPADNKRTDFQKIVTLSATKGVLALLSDSLGAERKGHTGSEGNLGDNFEREMAQCQGKFIVTTYSSNISRLNQAIATATKYKRKVCLLGRSLQKAKEVGERLGLFVLQKGQEITVDQLKNYRDQDILLLVAGSQGQENSAMSRIANDEHKTISLSSKDVIVFSSDPIPGNEVSVNALVDTIAKKGCKVVYSAVSSDFHVSGHGSSQELMLLMSLVKAKKVIPISGTYRQMVAYASLARKQGYTDQDILLLENGQEVVLSKNTPSHQIKKKVSIRNVYVDQLSGEEVESYVLRDRQKISLEGILIVMVEIDSSLGTLVDTPEIIARGFSANDASIVRKRLIKALYTAFSEKKARVTDWSYMRKRVSEVCEKNTYAALRRNPLILPVVIEV